ncbi:MAG: BMP family ABC transporter substrate-binding protein [Terrisporobacter sp.]|uniref:BMP family lipoprotein n=1 Tax=Terrisporobacter sp. TaxID=1965305 RepID=UPI002FC6DDA2
MKFKKIVAFAMAIMISTPFITGCTSKSSNTKKEDKTYNIAMITDVAGVNDQSFNQSAWEGLEKAKKDLGVEVKYLESKQDADYVTNVEALVDEEANLIIGVGSKLAPTIEKAAKDYPDQKFVLVDETYENIPKNVETILFNAEQSAYLVGLIAGKMTKTDKVGFIGGMDIGVINTFKYGYMAGVNAANSSCKVESQYANSFTDQAKGKAIANQMMTNDVDVIFTAGGDVGTGAIEAIKESKKYAIGVDRDQSDLAPDNVLTSAIKRVDVGVYETVKAYVDGTFNGGASKTYGLKENAVGIPESTSKLVPKDVLDYTNEQVKKLENGEIKVPKNEEEYNASIK